MALIYPLLFYPFTLYAAKPRDFLRPFRLAVRRPAGTGRTDRCARVLRGGAWNNNPDNLRSANRNNNTPDNRNNNIGLRCVVVSESARRCLARGANLARCGVGNWPAPPVPRSHLNCPPRPRSNRGQDAARAVAGNPAVRGTKVTARQLSCAASSKATM